MLEISSRSEALPHDQVVELFERFKAGDTAAGWELAISQQRLIAKMCHKCNGYLGTNVEDLIQEHTLRFFTALPSFDPTTMSICEFTFKITDRLGQTCRKLACRPMQLATCKRLWIVGSFDLDGLSMRDSHYDEIFAKLRDVDDAVDACSKITPEGVLALRLLAKGHNHSEIRRQLLESFPQALSKGRGNWPKKLRALIDTTINEIREVIGESDPIRIARRCLTESDIELLIKKALSATKMSPEKLSRLLLNDGISISWQTVHTFYRDYDIRQRQKLVCRSPKMLDKVAAETFAEWKMRTRNQNLPSAEEMQMSDEMWRKIEPVIFNGKRAWLFRDCRAKTNGLIYKIRTGCSYNRIPREFCATEDKYFDWLKTLKKLGILEQVLDIAEEYYPDMAEARAKYGS